MDHWNRFRQRWLSQRPKGSDAIRARPLEQPRVAPAGVEITNYWICFYRDDDGCTICGNAGVIDTRHVKGARVNWCICPQGQVLRQTLYGTGPGFNGRAIVKGDL